jgi:hypothetical protein
VRFETGIYLKKQTSNEALDLDVDLFKELQKFQKRTNMYTRISKVSKADPDLIDGKMKTKMSRLKLRKRTTRYSFDSSSSEFELPKCE